MAMTTSETDDKRGEALKMQRFKMLEDIAAEMSESMVFPTCFDVSLRLRNALRDPDISIDRIAAIVQLEPLICSRLIRMANVAALRSGSEVRDSATAVMKLGIKAVRNIVLAVAINQLVKSKELLPFSELSRRLWEHSIHTSSAAGIIGRKLSSVNPDEAAFAGLVHDLGAFYMLYRAAQYDELRTRPESLRYLISNWHESIGESLLFALKLPEELIKAAAYHDEPRPPLLENPRTLSDVVYAANALSSVEFDWLSEERVERKLGDQYHALVPEIDAHYQGLLAEYA